MPIAREEMLAGRAQAGDLRDHPEDVELPAVLRRSAISSGSRAERRGIEVGIVSPAAVRRAGAFRARIATLAAPVLHRLFRHAYPAAQARQHRRARASRSSSGRWRTGARSSTFERYLLVDPAITSAGRPQSYLRPQSRTKSRTSGSAISSPWPGGTTCGSTKASPAGWRPRPPRASGPTGIRCSTRVDGRETAMGSTRFATHAPGRPANPHGRTDQPGVRRDHLLEGRGGHRDARGLCRGGRLARRHAPLHGGQQYGNATSDDLWRRVERAGARGLTGSRTISPLSRACRWSKSLRAVAPTARPRVRGASRIQPRPKRASRRAPQRWRVPLLVSVGGGAPQRQVMAARPPS